MLSSFVQLHAATVGTTRQLAHLLDEVTKERRAWPHFTIRFYCRGFTSNSHPPFYVRP